MRHLQLMYVKKQNQLKKKKRFEKNQKSNIVSQQSPRLIPSRCGRYKLWTDIILKYFVTRMIKKKETSKNQTHLQLGVYKLLHLGLCTVYCSE